MTRLRACAVLAVVLTAGVLAQPAEEVRLQDVAHIETVGEAVLEVPVTFFDLHLYFVARETDSVEAGMRACEDFLKGLEPALRAASVQFLEVTSDGPSVGRVTRSEVFVQARVRMRLGMQGHTDDGFVTLAQRIDQVKAVAKQLGAVDVVLERLPLDEQPVELQAVQAATEAAFPRADVIAQAMGAQIIGVDHAEVEVVEWPDHVEGRNLGLDTVFCRARVRMIYQAAP